MRLSGLVAYPSEPREIGTSVRSALTSLEAESRTGLSSWEENDVAGRFLTTPILSKIETGNILIADITRLNFNVTFEIGYAIGKQRRVYLIRNAGLVGSDDLIREVGIFDTLGYDKYTNSRELAELLRSISSTDPLVLPSLTLNNTFPLYLVLPRIRTDAEIQTVSRIKKARLEFRSYDPEEQGRFSAREAIENVVQSHGVVTILLSRNRVGWNVHNFRAAFVAGLALAMDRALLLLQDGDEPVPLDYRDLVKPFRFPDQINEHVNEFALEISARFQRSTPLMIVEPSTLLQRINLGASAAENELRDLDYYYLETDEFRRTFRGEVRVVSGRKGAGKTALFAYLRDRLRQNNAMVVLDLKPEGFQLLKFKERVLDFLEEGTREHTITAFWEYMLFLEITRKLLEKDRQTHMRDSRLYEPYRDLNETYQNEKPVAEADFAERMLRLTQRIADDFEAARYNTERGRTLDSGAITELIYRHDLARLRDQLVRYLQFKDGVWVLIDNLDKGWPAHGVTPEDVLTLRSLLDAFAKIEHDLDRHAIECHAIVFIRNDVFELLIDATPDRGKVSRVLLDWTDQELLREMLRRRFVYGGSVEGTPSFNEIWRQIAVTHIGGEDSSQYLIERCLMRPRGLIELLQYCRSHAVNLRRNKIEVDDILKGEDAYSADVLNNLTYEIRDVFPAAGDVLYQFIESSVNLTMVEARESIKRVLRNGDIDRVMDLLLWYGFFGVVRADGEASYIYDVKYDMRRLRAYIDQRAGQVVNLRINAAFWRALEVKNTDQRKGQLTLSLASKQSESGNEPNVS
jgi:hypothetical protein